MKIAYYLLNEETTPEFEAFQAIHQDIFLKTHYKQLKNQELVTELFILNESIVPFLQNIKVVAQLKTEDLNGLPIVEIDGKIERVGKLLSVQELSDRLDIGITMQTGFEE